MNDQTTVDMRARLQQWRREHPLASFDEIEDAVQAEVVRWQAQLLDEVIQAGGPDVRAAAENAPASPTCGGRLQRCGRRVRTVLSRLGQPIRLERGYYVCPACEAGLFPRR